MSPMYTSTINLLTGFVWMIFWIRLLKIWTRNSFWSFLNMINFFRILFRQTPGIHNKTKWNTIQKWPSGSWLRVSHTWWHANHLEIANQNQSPYGFQQINNGNRLIRILKCALSCTRMGLLSPINKKLTLWIWWNSPKQVVIIPYNYNLTSWNLNLGMSRQVLSLPRGFLSRMIEYQRIFQTKELD